MSWVLLFLQVTSNSAMLSGGSTATALTTVQPPAPGQGSAQLSNQGSAMVNSGSMPTLQSASMSGLSSGSLLTAAATNAIKAEISV